ncbi:LysR family transcriptional regulator [Volucribacter psittacicida]|uniref:LysR family transcriptional regulator n=1 Tax=Volucribacter psittacicida TaxID=203482 RepID=A0A4R1G2D7_9PAST|nr:LysR family transcriptional regulator [Volucribacter psittacicida]TCJ97841.1 LysR family transcriptional regulator [Volucribacter psittacicida]
MYDFRNMLIFIKVVETGSMTKAAEQLMMTSPAVTQAIKKLEQQLAIKLFHRTTRKLSLTEAGEVFYQHIAHLQQQADNAINAIDALRHKPMGQLNIACVTGFVDSLLMQTFKKILAQYPAMNLNLYFEDKLIDLVEQRIDIALRVGKNSLQNNMIAKHLFDIEMVICASPDYLAQQALPNNLDELAALDWINFRHQSQMSIHFQRGQQQTTITPNYRVQCNSVYNSRSLTLNGFGVSMQPKLDVQAHLQQGNLIQLCAEWKLPLYPLYLVRLQRIQSEKMRIICELIEQYFAQLKTA